MCEGDKHLNYLVVWRHYQSGSFSDIYGARVEQSGNVLDTAGIPISTATGKQFRPSIAFDGTNYLVVWRNWRTKMTYDIYGARVEQSGGVLDTVGIAFSTAANNQCYSSVAFDGTNYLVVWQDWRSGFSYDIHSARVDQSGVVLDTVSIAIATAVDNLRIPSVAFDGTNYLVVWEHFLNEEDADIYGARVNQSGVILDTVSIAISNNIGYYQSSPSVAFDGTNYLVVWEDSWFESDIQGARVDQSGNVLDPGGIIISHAFEWQYSPSIAFDGTNYLVVWQNWDGINSYKISGARVDQSGTVLDPGGFPIPNSTHNSNAPSVAFDGLHYLVVWIEVSSICGARVDQSGNVLDPGGFPISIAVEGPLSPSVAFDGINYFVLWSAHCSDSSRDIYGAKVDTSGAVIDSFVVTHQSGDQSSPALAYGMGDQFLITYTGWTDSIRGHSTNAMRIWGKFYPAVGVEEKTKHPFVQCWKLRVYPNPFRKRAEIRLWIEDVRCKMDDVSLRIYDVSGRLINSFSLPTHHSKLPTTVSWDGRDNSGKEVHAGVYFLKFKAGEYKITKKLLKIK